MKENIVAARYADALFQEAKAENKLEQVIAQLSAVSAASEQSADFKTLIKSPLIGKAEKQAVVDVLKSKGMIDEFLYKFLKLLVSKNRLSLLELISSEIKAMDRKAKGEAEAVITVATAMDEASKSTLKAVLDKITGKKITITENVDPSILGGVIAQVESSLYDASVRGQLNKIKEQLV
ncbi:ATP synthase F1 subunit delta [Seleniivibrio woodruffii]|uniref:ATP synthase subunit delta n=1 Tax=Seleniivibrio woodruffii TaxID=1078050 RepID=A0A4R1KEK6_9BACT|nr:ATP synthase F1 subunit delta [Seleniivibrio woodruffii]TCK62520.1 ATP synthase F1 subcomplex delta subunit [Seleniivibrio woodruffii]TVZ37053.1 F-type H+-transporting ATPase subunit delta [Seleniivibrio woodruffii]